MQHLICVRTLAPGKAEKENAGRSRVQNSENKMGKRSANRKSMTKDADGGNIPLGKYTIIDFYKQAGPNTGHMEWLFESPTPLPNPPKQ